MGRLFGTDGARGVANAELTPELAMNIGRAAAMVLISDEVEHPTILIGKDTRLSGDMLEGALIADFARQVQMFTFSGQFLLLRLLILQANTMPMQVL